MIIISETWKNFGQLEQTLCALIIIIFIYVFTRSIIIKQLEKISSKTSNDIDDRLVHFIKKFFGFVTFFLTVVVLLYINNIEISPLLAGAGIASVALGFAAKETIADILAGIFLISDRPIRIGDRVKIDFIGRHWGAWGDVVDIGIRRTRIRNTDGVVVIYPNSQLSNSIINNFSCEKKAVRVRIRFQVGYNADIDLTRKIAIESIQSIPEVIPDTVQIVLRSIWDDSKGHLMSGVLLEGRYRIEDIRKRTSIRSEVLEKLLHNLQKNKIPLALCPIHITSK